MTRGKGRKPGPPMGVPSPARVAVHMLDLGYSAEYVWLWLWHMTRVEANVGVPEAPPEWGLQ